MDTRSRSPAAAYRTPYNPTWEPLVPTPAVEFWFDFGSNYSYLSAMRIEAAAARLGVRVLWRPFLLGPIFRSFGWNSSPFVLQEAKGQYMWPVSYTHLTLPTNNPWCRSRWSPYH